MTTDTGIFRNETFEIPVAWQTLYTVPANCRFQVKLIHIANVVGSAKWIDLCVVPSGGSPGVDNALLWHYSCAANAFTELGSDLILLSGQSLRAYAETANCLVINLSGLES